MTVTTRFAPSPTGRLHVGNARTALVGWLFARAHGGRAVLRLDDTDRARSTAAFEAAIDDDLDWLGLTFDERHRQSARRAHHDLAFETLRRAGRVYACFETEDELAARRKAQLARGQPPIYDRAGRRLTEAERRAHRAAGRRPHWRFALDDGATAWVDLIQGEKRFQGGQLGDPVIRRADGQPTYVLATVVDDVELGISHVIRGDDHVTNTALHIQLTQALGARLPAFAHLPLLLDAAGRKLSKRLGGLDLATLRAGGVEPMALNAVLAALGTADPPRGAVMLDELVEGVDLGRFGRAPPRFEPAALEAATREWLRRVPFAVVRPRLVELGLGEVDARFWLAVRANLASLAEAGEWWAICHGSIAPVVEDPDFLARAAALLPIGALDDAAFADWLEAVGRASGRRGRALYRPLRLALTGREHGPELKHLLTLIGRPRIEARLRGGVA